ncbi:MAG TPA: ABC transporter substrate-binding protein [Baekduia sp.]
MSVPDVGTQLGRYRLEAVLGRGGMGVVYRAEDLRLGRKVALKLLAAGVTDTDDGRFRRRFLSESRLAASIDHASIIPIYEAGELDGHLFIAMRYVEGTDLATLLRREGPLEPGRALALVEQLASALDAAHAHGLVHRDVKPANVLVAREGTREHVYLADFGLTKHVTSEGPTASGAIVGTLDYLAPECIEGRPADERTDLYALGCLLFECLTGRVPFPRDSEAAALYAHLEDEPPRPSDLRPGLPPELDDVVRRALAKDPGERWPSGADLIAATRPADSSTTTTAGRAAEQGAGRRRLAVLGAAAAAAAAIVVALVAVLLGRDDDGGLGAIADANAVAVVDPGQAQLKATIPVGSSPSQIVAGAGALWATNTDGGTVSRIDPRTRTVSDTIDVGHGPSAVAVGAGAVWVVNTLDGTLSQIAPQVAREVAVIPIGNGPSGVCVAGGAVWVAGEYDRAIVRYDPVTRRKTTTRLDDQPTHLTCGGGSVWASSESSGTVTRLTAGARGRIVHRTAVGGGASGLAWGHGSVWVANTTDGTVSRIDGRTGVQTRVIPIGAGTRPANVAVADDGVWVSNERAGTVVHIDPSSNEAGQPLRIGQLPQGLAVLDGTLWVGVRASGAAHRGGRLRVLLPGSTGDVHIDATQLDPALLYYYLDALQITNDGLVVFARTGGRRSSVPVPALAQGLPAVTDGGRTYAFRLRRGLRYADGETVRASDFRHGLERVVARGIGDYYPFVRGVRRCTHRHCDLSAGIEADDAAGTIVFRLTQPDPDFLFKLALPAAMPVPARFGRVLHEPVPATGPYKIAGIDDRRRIRLVRNPRFRPTADRPDGYPDAITIEDGVGPRAAVRAVETGQADLLAGEFGLPPTLTDLLHDMATRHPERVHTSPRPITIWAFLNTRLPPFDHLYARRAVNFAVDRSAAVTIKGGDQVAHATCQILPGSFPGHRDYCPYTAAPAPGGKGPWRAPDLAEARRLVARSGTRGMHVTVVGPVTFLGDEARLIATTLKRIGYRVRLRLLPDQIDYFRYVQNTDHDVQVGPIGWGADWPSPRGFLFSVFNCEALRRHVSDQNNSSEYCDSQTDRLMQRAGGLRSTDPGVEDLWSRVDRRITDQAAVVPLVNPQGVSFVSRRVGNFQNSRQWAALLDQLWVK